MCATFSTSSSQDDPNGYDDSNGDYASFSNQFTHPAGHFCFHEFETPVDTSGDGGSNAPVPTITCIGNNCSSPTPYPYPSRFPCKAGEMYPMIPANQPSPAIYNGVQSVTQTPAPGGGGGSAG